jgi:hypothetical protein
MLEYQALQSHDRGCPNTLNPLAGSGRLAGRCRNMDLTLDDNTFQLLTVDLVLAIWDLFLNVVMNVLLPGVLTHFFEGLFAGLMPAA